MPEAFSANVFLRPVVESSVFPTIAYVGGPAEVSYFAQVSALFEAHGIEPPVAVPRFSVTLIERKVRKVMDSFGLAVTDFRPPTHEIAARVLRRRCPRMSPRRSGHCGEDRGGVRRPPARGAGDRPDIEGADPECAQRQPHAARRGGEADHAGFEEAERAGDRSAGQGACESLPERSASGTRPERLSVPGAVRAGPAPEIAETMQVRLGAEARSDG